jgi:hypothetical protein
MVHMIVSRQFFFFEVYDTNVNASLFLEDKKLTLQDGYKENIRR